MGWSLFDVRLSGGESLTGCVCQFPSCKCIHRGWFQARMELGCAVLSQLPEAGESSQHSAAFTALVFLAGGETDTWWIQVFRILSSLVRGWGGGLRLLQPQLLTSQVGKRRLPGPLFMDLTVSWTGSQEGGWCVDNQG